MEQKTGSLFCSRSVGTQAWKERAFSSQSSAYEVCNYWLSNSVPQELFKHGMVIEPISQYQAGLGILHFLIKFGRDV